MANKKQESPPSSYETCPVELIAGGGIEWSPPNWDRKKRHLFIRFSVAIDPKKIHDYYIYRVDLTIRGPDPFFAKTVFPAGNGNAKIDAQLGVGIPLELNEYKLKLRARVICENSDSLHVCSHDECREFLPADGSLVICPVNSERQISNG
ncbi:MAG: hypothetical protein P1U86_15955 [Verrucomicrobiales bacterium]|nr:hypothetical protein [Verrucomicrobiales bacterium]